MLGHAKLAREEFSFRPVRIALHFAQRSHDGLVPPHRGQDEGGLYPEHELRIARAVRTTVRGLPAHGSVAAADSLERALGGGAFAVDDRERCINRTNEAPDRRTAEVGMLIDARCDERMCHLHEERGRPAEQEKSLAVYPTSDAVDRQDPGVAHTTSVLLRSFAYAFDGVTYILRTQRNARIEAAVAIAAVVLAAWLGISAVEWAVLAITIALVLALEWINTSLELAVSLASPERHPSARAAKDVAAACVLLGAITSVVVGLLLFAPRVVARLAGT
jgi:undecaprenol kinase